MYLLITGPPALSGASIGHTSDNDVSDLSQMVKTKGYNSVRILEIGHLLRKFLALMLEGGMERL